jgi:hypothetical protein
VISTGRGALIVKNKGIINSIEQVFEIVEGNTAYIIPSLLLRLQAIHRNYSKERQDKWRCRKVENLAHNG